MKHTSCLLVFLITLGACRKPQETPAGPAHPQMIYTQFNNVTLGFDQAKGVDLDGNGRTDIVFYTMLVGDPILQLDRRQFHALSNPSSKLLNDAADQSPVLNHWDTITMQHEGYTWWEVSDVLMAEKLISNSGNTWQGAWRNASHQYLPVQLEQDGQLYHGWIELSFSTTEEKLILHRAAVSKEPWKAVKAGW